MTNHGIEKIGESGAHFLKPPKTQIKSDSQYESHLMIGEALVHSGPTQNLDIHTWNSQVVP